MASANVAFIDDATQARNSVAPRSIELDAPNAQGVLIQLAPAAYLTGSWSSSFSGFGRATLRSDSASFRRGAKPTAGGIPPRRAACAEVAWLWRVYVGAI